jgi:hypothetical protein
MLSFAASQLLHLELHALQPSTEHVPLGRLRPIAQPAEDVMDGLSAEMEKMIIEGQVKQDGGPFKSVWEAAVERGRRVAAAVVAVPPQTPTPQRKKSFNWGNLPGPRAAGFSPATSPLKGVFNNGHGSPKPQTNTVPWVNGNGHGNPPPQPQPNLDSRPSYVRGRSLSLV